MHVHTVIIGAGPGGLACAKILAEAGLSPLILERKTKVGHKVCAGGITWDGLIKRVPKKLVEKSFPDQYIHTNLQSFKVSTKKRTPIIATVNRQQLGQYMARSAKASGADLLLGCQVRKINGQTLCYTEKSANRQKELTFDYLVGADGSHSLVRKFLDKIPEHFGIGINYQIPGDLDKMEWHLDCHLFGNGYAWIFPHKKTISIGAYADKKQLTARKLKTNLLKWAAKRGFPLENQPLKAEYINYHYAGYCFGNIFLVGDAAGLASALTGEGIYPAILSGEEVARTIIDPDYQSRVMTELGQKHKRHRQLVELSGKSKIISFLLAELAGIGLRSGLIKFEAMEMAPKR